MTIETLKSAVKDMSFEKESGYAWIQQLVADGFFDSPVSSKDIVNRVAEKFHRRWNTGRVQVYIRRFVGMINSVRLAGSRSNYWVLATVSRQEALQHIGKTRRVVEIERDLFSQDLEKRLEKNFAVELRELRAAFGMYGNSTAFMLRKILEKLLVIVFRKVGKGNLIESSQRPGGLIGLEAMVELAMKEKVSAAPLLTGKTGNEIRGVKFLGDTAAHNPMVNVDVADILPQMPYIITAYKELSLHL